MLYGYSFAAGAHPICPPAARRFDDLDDAKQQLEGEARQHFRIESQPLNLVLFIGEPAGDEEHYGYPDYPDHLLSAECNDFMQDILITEDII